MSKTLYYFFRIACYALSIILAFTIALGSAFALMSVTLGNKNFAKGYFTSPSVTSALSQELYERLDEISQEYSFDSQTLQNAYKSDYLSAVQETAMNTLYSGTSAKVTDSINIEYRCRSALSGELSQEQVDEITEKVMQAFNDVYNIENAAEFSTWMSLFFRSTSFALMLVMMSLGICVIIYFMSGRRHISFNYIASSLLSAGGIMIALPLVFNFCSGYKSHMFTQSAAYNLALASALERTLYISIALGAVLAAVGIFIFITNYRYYSVKLERSDTEKEIEMNLI